MYADIASTIASEVYDDDLKNWIKASAPVTWANKIEQLSQHENPIMDHLSGINLSSVPSCALYGMVPQDLTDMIAELLSYKSGRTREGLPSSKTRLRASRMSQNINNLTSGLICEIWEERGKIREKGMPVTHNSKQTYLDQAKELASQGKLPGLANTGTMTFDEFLELPKPHQQRKVAMVLRDMHGLTPLIQYLLSSTFFCTSMHTSPLHRTSKRSEFYS